MKIETDKIIKYLEHCIESTIYEENYKAGIYYDNGFGYDQYDLQAREGKGHSEGYAKGYCKAMNEVIALLKKENK
jgi:hypothetical protein